MVNVERALSVVRDFLACAAECERAGEHAAAADHGEYAAMWLELAVESEAA